MFHPMCEHANINQLPIYCLVTLCYVRQQLYLWFLLLVDSAGRPCVIPAGVTHIAAKV